MPIHIRVKISMRLPNCPSDHLAAASRVDKIPPHLVLTPRRCNSRAGPTKDTFRKALTQLFCTFLGLQIPCKQEAKHERDRRRANAPSSAVDRTLAVDAAKARSMGKSVHVRLVSIVLQVQSVVLQRHDSVAPDCVCCSLARHTFPSSHHESLISRASADSEVCTSVRCNNRQEVLA